MKEDPCLHFIGDAYKTFRVHNATLNVDEKKAEGDFVSDCPHVIMTADDYRELLRSAQRTT